MQIDGDKFLRNLEIERERAALEKQKEELMFQRAQAYSKLEDTYRENSQSDNLNYQELDDIRIDKETSNKQKYILLGFILVLLFLITLVAIKLISEPVKENDFSQNEIVDEKKVETPTQTVNPEENQSLDIDKIIQSEGNANVQTQTPPPPPAEPAQSDIFGIEKKDKVVPIIEETPTVKPLKQTSTEVTKENDNKQQAVKPVAKEIIKEKKIEAKPKTDEIKKDNIKQEQQKQEKIKKDIIKEAPIKSEHKVTEAKKTQKEMKQIKDELWKQTPTTIDSTKIENKTEAKDKPSKEKQAVSDGDIYIQAGAFTAVPDQKLIETLKKNNFKYTFKQVEVDGKPFSKLFIGGYQTKDKALSDLAKVRSEINPKAFIPKGQ